MANGYLNGLRQIWLPNVALGSLKSQLTAPDFPVDPNLSIVPYASFPDGYAVLNAGTIFFDMTTPAYDVSPLGGQQDYMLLMEAQLDDPASNAAAAELYQGDPPPNWDFQVSLSSNIGNAHGELTVDAGHLTVSGANDMTTPGPPLAILSWWTAADQVLHTQSTGQAEAQVSSPGGIPSSISVNLPMYMRLDASFPANSRMGRISYWCGTIPNSPSQIAGLLGLTIPFSAFDSGGGGGPSNAVKGGAFLGMRRF